MQKNILSFIRIIMFMGLCSLLFFFSCRINTDKDEEPENDIRILPHDIQQALVSFTSDAPAITELRTIGNSSGTPSYPMYALKITDNPEAEENEPEIQMTGGVHGNEQLSIMMVLKLIEYIIDNYPSDPQIENLVDNYELHFFPVLNPFGLAEETRLNANSVDLNRNFGWAWVNQAQHGSSALDQPESRAIQADALNHPYSLSLHGHTGAVCINTLWDYIGTTKSMGDPSTYTEEEFIANYLPTYPFITSIAAGYSNSVNEAGDKIFKMTEGYDWYPVFGSIQDWFYGERGSMAFTLEYHSSFNYTELDEAIFREIFDYHKDALINIFLDAGKGISGIVTGTGGIAIDAKVTIGAPATRTYTDPSIYRPFAFTDPDVGDYHIPIQPGIYEMTFEADGYVSKTVTDVVVPASDPWTIVLDAQLIPGKSEKSASYKPPDINIDSIPPDLRGE